MGIALYGRFFVFKFTWRIGIGNLDTLILVVFLQ